MMSVTEDKVFEDQIERMKQKNKLILERFQASEEDRKCAETSGSTIHKNQNVQIRLRNDDQMRRRKKSNPPPLRPKSFHGGTCDTDNSHMDYNHFNESRKQGKFNRTSKVIDDEVAYQDYFHFQQAYCTKTDQNYQSNRSSYHQSHSYTDDNYGYKPNYRDYQRSTSQKSKTSPRYNQNTFQNVKSPNVSDHSMYKVDNTKINTKESHTKINSNIKKKPKSKLDSANNQNVDPAGDRKVNIKTPNPVLEDEYIDDTIGDLEQYRLKIDMDDFTVKDPECPNPILAKPLTSWTNDSILTEISSQNGPREVSSSDLLNGSKEGTIVDSIEQANIDNLTKMELAKCNGENVKTIIQLPTITDEIITGKEELCDNDKVQIVDASKENVASETQVVADPTKIIVP